MKIAVELGGICEPNTELMVLPSHPYQELLSHNALDCRLCRREKALRGGVDQAGDGSTLPRRRYDDEWAPEAPRLDTYQHAPGYKVFPRALEGMDHALDRNSSK